VALFLSTFFNKVDGKGRVSVPASFRQALTGQSFAGIVLFPAVKFAALEGSGIDRLQLLSQRIDSLPEFSDERAAISAIFADAQPLPFDGEGRVMLPSWLAEHAGITETAAFVGIGSTFQIWEPERFQRHQAEMRKLARNVTLPAPAGPLGGGAVR
jgi:MraZ protein